MPTEKPPSLCERISAFALHSSTVALSYFFLAAGIIFDPTVIDIIGGQEFKDAVVLYLGPHGANGLKVIGLLVFLARFRGIFMTWKGTST